MSGNLPISDRSLRVPPSPIRKLVPLAEQAKKRGLIVYRLNIGQPDIPTPPEFFKAVAEYPQTVLEYGRSQGEISLLEALSNYYASKGYAIQPENIQVTTGGSEAISFALLIVAQPGDEILVFEPFYTNYNSFAVTTGVKLVPVPTSAETGFHLPGRVEIESRITSKTRAILICTPNNPTGTVYQQDEMQMLGQICRERDLYLISDEAYRELVYFGEHFGVLNLNEQSDRVILVDSFSKRFSLCGARLGCLVSKNKDVMQAAFRLGQARLSPPTLDEYGLFHTLKLGNGYFQSICEEYKKRRDLVFSELKKIPDVVCQQPEGAFYVMAKFPIPDIENFASWLLTDFNFENQTLMIAPGPGFYATPGKGRQEARIAYVLGIGKLRRAMQTLKEAVKAYSAVPTGID
ncbi:MAG: pyridoxal phosphate-dependent aminotransferase [candidate division Zixibacteria bacterium]|nr:pyridoxal phosphate-dependent aminotransferase [candidate division Zixibacteria bacterium]